MVDGGDHFKQGSRDYCYLQSALNTVPLSLVPYNKQPEGAIELLVSRRSIPAGRNCLVHSFLRRASLLRGIQHPTIPRSRSGWIKRGQAILFFLSVAGCATLQPPVRPCKSMAPPLSPDSRFQLKKVRQFFNEPSFFFPTTCEVINFERNSVNHGAISQGQFDRLRGNYFSFLWCTSTRANTIVRFEYRQNSLGNKTRALECCYPNALGSYKSEFRVIGEDYSKFGRVVSWRILLIAEGKIVALRQSFL